MGLVSHPVLANLFYPWALNRTCSPCHQLHMLRDLPFFNTTQTAFHPQSHFCLRMGSLLFILSHMSELA